MKNTFKYLVVTLCLATLVGCSLFSEEIKGIEKSFQKTTFFYPDQEVMAAVTQVLKEDGFRIKKKNFREGVIETFPKKNKGLFAKAFSGGLFRTTVDVYVQRVNPEKTLVMLSMKIEKQITVLDEDSFEEKMIKKWEEMEVIEDQLSLLGNDSYENYFSRIDQTIKKNRTNRLIPASSSGYGGSFLQTPRVKPIEGKKAADSPEPSPLKEPEEKVPEGFEDLD